MLYPVLLLTADAALSQRVTRAVACSLPLELRCSPELIPPPPGRTWLAILLDAPAIRPQSAAAAFLTGTPIAPAPLILWLGEQPQLTAAGRLLPGCYERVADYLDREWPVSKLAFILQHRLKAAYLRRNHQVSSPGGATHPGSQPDGSELQRQINNALTGIVGNAELLLDPARRLPPPLRQRLACISDLAGEIGNLIQLWSSRATAPLPPHSQSSA